MTFSSAPARYRPVPHGRGGLVGLLFLVAALGCGLGGAEPVAEPILTPVGSPQIAAPAWTGDALPRATMRRPAQDLPAESVDLMVRAGELVAGAADHELIVWDREGREIRRVPLREVGAIALSEAGLVAGAGADGTIVVVDARSGDERLRQQVPATDVALSADGAWLAVATDDDIRLVDLATGATTRTIVPEYGADAVGFAPDGKTLWSSDPFAHHAWDVATGAELARFGGGFASTFRLREGVLWVFLDGVDPPQRYDATTYTRIADLKLADTVYTGDVDARRLMLDGYATDPVTMRRVRVTASDVEDVTLPRDDEVWFATGTAIERWRVLDAARLVDGPVRVPRPDEDDGNVIGGAVWTDEGLAVALAGPRVRRYGADGPVDVTLPCSGDGYDCEIGEVRLAKDAIEVVLYDESVWRVRGTKATKARGKAKEEGLVGVGGVRLVAVDDEGVVGYAPDGTERFRIAEMVRVSDLALSPDGRWLVIADVPLRLVDVEAGREVAQVVFAEDYGVDHVAFSPDGREIAAVQTWESGDHVWVVPLDALR